MKKVLIIQTAYIGDVVLATSLVEKVIEEFPEVQIDFFLRAGNESIIETNPNVKNVFIWDKKKKKFSSLIKNLLLIRKEKYDAVLNIQRFFNSGLVTALSGAKKRVGFDKNPMSFLFTHKIKHEIPHKSGDSFLHEVERNFQLANVILDKKASRTELRPKLYFNEEDHDVINSLPLNDSYIVMAPASVWYTKQWHIDKWRELIQMIPSSIQIYLIGASSDQDDLFSLVNNKNVTSLCGKLSLRQSALLMQKALRVFVNDSAPLHLASSVNANTTAIFCSTVPEFGYGPLSEDSKLIQLEPRLDCMPCGLHGQIQCPQIHFQCSKNIETKAVFDTINL